jgi:hypothetical protein
MSLFYIIFTCEYTHRVSAVPPDSPCIMRKECKRNRLRVKAGKRAAKFEDKMEGRKKCRRAKKNNTEEKEKKKYFQRNGYEVKKWKD